MANRTVEDFVVRVCNIDTAITALCSFYESNPPVYADDARSLSDSTRSIVLKINELLDDYEGTEYFQPAEVERLEGVMAILTNIDDVVSKVYAGDSKAVN